MGLSLVTAPATVAFIGSPVAAMPQKFVIQTNRYTASPKTSTAISNSSGKVRYAYTSHPYKVGDVITASAYTDSALNVRQTVMEAATNTFDTDLVWQAGFTGLTGTVTRTNDNLQIAATLRVGGVGVVTGRIPVNSSGQFEVRVDRALLREMQPDLPPDDDDAELDTETYLLYSIYCKEEFDDKDGVLKTADDYTSGTYQAAYGHRKYKDARTVTDYLLTLGSYRKLLTPRDSAKTILMPRGARLYLSGLIEGGVGITDVRVESVQQAGGSETTEAGDPVSTSDAYCKVVTCYGPDVYAGNVSSAEVYLKANNTTRISEKLSVLFLDATRYLTFFWINHLGGWDSISLTHYKRIEQTTTDKKVAWSRETATYTVGDAQAAVFDVQAKDGFMLRGQVPADGSARVFAGILESEKVLMYDTDGTLMPVIVEGDGIDYRENDELSYYELQVTYATHYI